MNRHINILIVLGLLGCASVSRAQKNIDEILRDPSNNFYTIQQRAEAWFAARGTQGTGYKEYKRWEAMVRHNIDPDGSIPDFTARNKQALDNFRRNYMQAGRVEGGVAAWTPLGQPNPTILAGDPQNGVGSIRSIDFQGSDIWVTTPGGGIWFGDYVSGSTYSWSPKTDGISNLAVQDMEIAPTNSSIMYALTGSVGNASGYKSTGVLKSTDGGTTWNETGLTFPVSGSTKGYKILCSSTNSNVVWACTTSGLYRTTDGGTTWNLVTYSTTVGGPQTDFSLESFDIEYKPGSTSAMYATSANYFYTSSDGGATFLRVTLGLPATGDRIEIGVTDANTSYVYLLYGDGANFQGLYRSTNSGSSFSLRSTTPNVLGSQSWRNTPIVVAPDNAETVYVGGLDVYKSTTGGSTWTQISDWTSTSTTDFCHADIFDLYCDASYLYAATDGGMYRMTRSTDNWISLNNNMQIGQSYRIGIDPTASAAFVTSGLQDNGTYRNTGAQYLNIGGGDGMETIVNPTNTNVIYLSSQNGAFRRSDDGGVTSASIRTGAGNWTTPAVLRPGNSTHIYIGYTNIDYNTTSGTGAWSSIATGFGSAIESLEFAPSNSTILYATDGASVKRFNLSGGVWSTTTITGNLPALSAINELSVDPNDPNHVVLCVGGYTATQKVYETFNANVASPTWTSIVRNLPNVPVNCIVIDDDLANSIYIGTDIGVFVTNDNRVNWIMYNNGLPPTRVYDLEINNALATNRIYASTFGRGVFYSEVYTGCSSSFSLSGSVSGLGYTEASTSITSTQVISGGDGTSVAYNAGGSILLSTGFQAKGGARFEAYLQGCTGAGQPPRPLRIVPAGHELELTPSAPRPNPEGN